VKYCSAPSKRCSAASSPVRSTPESLEDLRSISFCPPLPRVAVASAVRYPCLAIEHHQQPVVLVVRCRRVHEDAGIGEMPQHESERDVPLLVIERDNAHLSSGKGDKRGDDDEKREKRSASYW
jgi:hypothetical protein